MSELYGKREDLLLEHEEQREKVGERFGTTFEKAKGNASCEDLHRDIERMKEILDVFGPLIPESAKDKLFRNDPWRILFEAHMRVYWHWQAVVEKAQGLSFNDGGVVSLVRLAVSEREHAVRRLADSFEKHFGLEEAELVSYGHFMPREEDPKELNFMHAVVRELQYRVCEKTGIGHPRYDGCTCKFLSRNHHVCTCGAGVRMIRADFQAATDAIANDPEIMGILERAVENGD